MLPKRSTASVVRGQLPTPIQYRGADDYPPLHPNCRCVPMFVTWDDFTFEIKNGRRISDNNPGVIRLLQS